MKIFVLITCFALFSIYTHAQSKDTFYVQKDMVILSRDTAMRTKLLQVNLKKYVGKRVGTLLNDPTIKLYKSYWWSDEPPMKLRSLNLSYARGLDLKIYVHRMRYQPRFSMDYKFSFELFKKERISAVEIDREYFEKNVVQKYAQ